LAFGGKTILFAWELGEGLGHLPPLKAIGAAVKAEGATPVFALRDPVQTRAALAELDALILPAPQWPTPVQATNPSGSYADIMSANGFSSAANIAALLGAWDEIVDLTKPDLVICEHAPGAALSVFGRVPAAFVGNGFVVPPADGAEFPPYELGKGEPSRQKPVLEAMQEAMAKLGRAAPRTICEPYRGVFRGIYTFPELDTYRRRRSEAVLGPIEPMPPLTPLPVKRHLFAYSAADYVLVNEVAQALMDVGPEASAYFRGSLGARAAVIKSRGVTVHDAAPALTSAFGTASAAFSHGGTGFTHAALAAGRPHVVVPRHGEARLTGRALEELGAGVCVLPFEAKAFREAVKRAHDDAAMRAAAQKAGAAAQAFLATATPLETTMEALRRVLG